MSNTSLSLFISFMLFMLMSICISKEIDPKTETEITPSQLEWCVVTGENISDLFNLNYQSYSKIFYIFCAISVEEKEKQYTGYGNMKISSPFIYTTSYLFPFLPSKTTFFARGIPVISDKLNENISENLRIDSISTTSINAFKSGKEDFMALSTFSALVVQDFQSKYPDWDDAFLYDYQLITAEELNQKLNLNIKNVDKKDVYIVGTVIEKAKMKGPYLDLYINCKEITNEEICISARITSTQSTFFLRYLGRYDGDIRNLTVTMRSEVYFAK